MKIVEFGKIIGYEDGRVEFKDFILDRANPTPKDLLVAVIGFLQEELNKLDSDAANRLDNNRA